MGTIEPDSYGRSSPGTYYAYGYAYGVDQDGNVGDYLGWEITNSYGRSLRASLKWEVLIKYLRM